MDNLGFLANGNSIEKVAANLEKTRETVLRWGISNAVMYNIAKTEAILFSQTRWLGIQLNSGLIFSIHIKERIKYTRAAKARIKGLTRDYRFPAGLVKNIQIADVQAIALFDVEIWWHGQKWCQEEIQKLLNRQRRAITDMY